MPHAEIIGQVRRAAFVGGAVGLAALASAQTWQAIPLGTLGGPGAAAFGVNDMGHVVGASDTDDGSFRAFVWRNGVMTDLGTLEDGTLSTAFSINNAGVVVGRSTNAAGVSRAVRWVPGAGGAYTIEDLGTFAGTGFSWATRVNQAGQIAGYATVATGAYHAFRWTDGVMLDLGTLHFSGNRAYSQGLGINDAGQVVGFAYATLQGPEHGFLHTGSQQLDITPIAGAFSLAQGHNVNNAGLVAGYIANNTTAGAFRAGVYDPDSQEWTLIEPLDETSEGYAYDINNAGQVVGTSFMLGAPGLFKGFALFGARVLDLNEASSGSPGMITDAFDISDTGFIAATAESVAGPVALLLAPPTPCPADLDGDRTIGLGDLAILLTHFGTPDGARPSDGDLDRDGDVDLADLAALLVAFGTNC
jgi:probable HAF family extracellular repeat protein